MPFCARCFHHRHPSQAVGTAATAATGKETTTPIVTVAAVATPAANPLRRDSSTTSLRDLLIVPPWWGRPGPFASRALLARPSRPGPCPAGHDVDIGRGQLLVEARHVLFQFLGQGLLAVRLEGRGVGHLRAR